MTSAVRRAARRPPYHPPNPIAMLLLVLAGAAFTILALSYCTELPPETAQLRPVAVSIAIVAALYGLVLDRERG